MTATDVVHVEHVEHGASDIPAPVASPESPDSPPVPANAPVFGLRLVGAAAATACAVFILLTAISPIIAVAVALYAAPAATLLVVLAAERLLRVAERVGTRRRRTSGRLEGR